MEQCMSDFPRIGCSVPQILLDSVSLGRFNRQPQTNCPGITASGYFFKYFCNSLDSVVG